ncbi:MAG TPA: hypothetical protein VEH84_09860 [Alphaproteobacteria bacterium]|nr:hypothetical protein [Alphaproteobacteria bacterium]
MTSQAQRQALFDRIDAEIAPRLRRGALTLDEHQQRLGDRPLTRAEAARLHPAEAVERNFRAPSGADDPDRPAQIALRRTGGATEVLVDGRPQLVLDWPATEAEALAALAGYYAGYAAGLARRE